VGGPLRIGIVGVGKISEQYLANLPSYPGLRLVAVADLDAARAARVAAEQGVDAVTVDELLVHPDVDAVLNLTIPSAHVEIGTRAALAASRSATATSRSPG
jgi:predicted dehydrogenase